MWLGNLGNTLLWVCLIASFLTIGGYGFALKFPKDKKALLAGRLAYSLTAISMIAVFGVLGYLMHTKTVGGFYRFAYIWEHTSNDLQGLYRFSATWSGQEGSFLLWGMWTSILGFLVFAKAGKYEARVMPVFVTVITFLALILIKQSPFAVIPAPTAELLKQGFNYPQDGQGLNASLQNYWMTIHPPTIFFGFASLAVPFAYAIAALIWKDYEDWTPRVMPYALLTCCTLGVGLFMGGYWAYETQGWHGFWGWDPVENASFFPWLAITALVHGLVVQRDRGGMAKTNTFLGLLAFWLFLLGTFLTRSGALSGKGADGAELSVHAFANIGKSGLSLMIAMMAGYGILALGLWIWRARSIPGRKTTGDSLMSRDFAFFMAVTLMMVSCVIITLGTTTPLFMSWAHKPPTAPQPVFYNRAMMPITLVTAFMMGVVPWLAWKKTSTETFLKKMMIPWFAMLGFGFFMLFWILNAQHDLQLAHEAVLADLTLHHADQITDLAWDAKQAAWINPAIQRMSVLGLVCLGFLSALSNSMLAYKVFRAKPINAGGWIAHVGIALLIIGAAVSNTFERTVRFEVTEGAAPVKMFGYEFAWERTTGKPYEAFPLNPEFDRNNSLELRITPPENEKSVSADGSKTYLAHLRYYISNFRQAESASEFQNISWPHIQKYMGHDLYIGMAALPQPQMSKITLEKGASRAVGPYLITYVDDSVSPGKEIRALVKIKTPEGQEIEANPTIQMTSRGGTSNVNTAIPELRDENNYPGVVVLDKIDPETGSATLFIRLPKNQYPWIAPLEVTYKPWVNLVWLGVIIMGLGIALAMARRALEARKVSDGILAHDRDVN